MRDLFYKIKEQTHHLQVVGQTLFRVPGSSPVPEEVRSTDFITSKKRSVCEFDSGKHKAGRNCMEIAPQALMFAAGVVLAVALISMMVIQFDNARELSLAVGEELADTALMVEESDLTKYDGLTVTGSDVVNFCRRHINDGVSLCLEYSRAGLKVSGLTQTDITALRDSESEMYVKPSDSWSCQVERNANDVITDILFTRKEI